jgi:hypothetical protein
MNVRSAESLIGGGGERFVGGRKKQKKNLSLVRSREKEQRKRKGANNPESRMESGAEGKEE